MNKLTSLFAFIALVAMSCSSTTQNESSIVKTLLPEGTHQFEVLDSVETTPRQIELMVKFQKAYKGNMDLFNAYFEKTRSNENVNFPENPHITEEELNEVAEYSRNIKLMSSGPLKVVIRHSNGKVSFKSTGKLEILNYLEFNFSKDIATIENYELPFKDSTIISTSTNALQDSWKGYIWEFTDPQDIDLPTSETIQDISFKRYKVTLGTLDKTNKTFMILKGLEVKEGQKIVEFEIPIKMK